jgi:PKHD-type hydroxylase
VIIRLPGLLDSHTLDVVRAHLADAPWEDGRGSAHGRARDVKHSLVVPLEHEASRAAGKTILERLSGHEGFKATTLPKTILPLKFCRYDASMGYGDHLDLPVMGTTRGTIRTDVSMTLFLTGPDDYTGGDLVFDSDYGVHRMRAAAGDAVLYPSSTLHRVDPVERGTRLVAVTWIQSMVRDAGQRRILFDIASVATELESDPERADAVQKLRKSHYNLLRLWAEQ